MVSAGRGADGPMVGSWAVPNKHFFYRNAVRGATDRIHVLTDEVGVRWVENTSHGLKIPD